MDSAPPDSESSTNNVDNNQKDLNLNYKIIAILVSISTFFIPYLGPSSPFSIFFQDESFLLDEVIYSNFMPIEVFLIVFALLIAGFLPVLSLIFSIISLVLIKFNKSIKLQDMFYLGLVVFCYF